MHPASKDGKWHEFTSRVQTLDTSLLWDAYNAFYERMKASGRPMPPRWRQPSIWGLFVKYLAVEFYLSNGKEIEFASQETLVSLFVELARRMSPDDLNEAQRRLEDDEPTH